MLVIINHSTHQLIADKVTREFVQQQFGGDEVLYIRKNHPDIDLSKGNITWEWITSVDDASSSNENVDNAVIVAPEYEVIPAQQQPAYVVPAQHDTKRSPVPTPAPVKPNSIDDNEDEDNSDAIMGCAYFIACVIIVILCVL